MVYKPLAKEWGEKNLPCYSIQLKLHHESLNNLSVASKTSIFHTGNHCWKGFLYKHWGVMGWIEEWKKTLVYLDLIFHKHNVWLCLVVSVYILICVSLHLFFIALYLPLSPSFRVYLFVLISLKRSGLNLGYQKPWFIWIFCIWIWVNLLTYNCIFVYKALYHPLSVFIIM